MQTCAAIRQETLTWFYGRYQFVVEVEELILSTSIRNALLNGASTTKVEPPSRGETCWHKTYETPTILAGYPIRNRPYSGPGLEVSRDILIDMADIYEMVPFEDTLEVRGVSVLFFPTAITHNSITWHFMIDEDGASIGVSAIRACKTRVPVTQEELNSTTMRHFVGWTTGVQLMIGKAAYSNHERIEAGGASNPTGRAVDGFGLSGGFKLNGSIRVVPSNRGQHLQCQSKLTYERKIYAAQKWHVALHDTDTQRAFLIDGASCLLLMGRSILSNPHALPVVSEARDQLRLVGDDNDAPDSVVDVLLDEENRTIRLNPKHTFQDAIDNCYERLNAILEHMKDLSSARTGKVELKLPTSVDG